MPAAALQGAVVLSCLVLCAALGGSKHELDNAHGALGFVPVLGVPVLHDPNFFLTRLVYSIDFPVRHLVIYHNANDPIVSAQLKHIKANYESLHAIPTVPPMGVAEGWNAILQAFPAERWFLIVAYDIQLLPGSLERLVAHAAKHTLCQAHLAVANFPASLANYNAFMVTAALLKRVGYFDENIFPAFFEDTEWEVRLKRLADPPCVPEAVPDAIYIHGFRTDTDYVTGVKRLRNNASLELILEGHRVNGYYVAEKWGCPPPQYVDWGKCSFATPFNDSALALSDWHLNTTRRKQILQKWEPG